MTQLLRRCAVLFLIALAVSISSNAFAGTPSGINLSWTDCSTFGTQDRTSLCTSNTGASIIVASLVASPGLDSVVAITAVVDFTSATDPLPAWWQMSATGCRNTSVSASFAFTTYVNCIDYWNGQGLGISDYQVDSFVSSGTASPTNHARFRGTCGIPTSNSSQMTPGMEYYMAAVVINNQRTVGGTCPGCLTPACIVLNAIETYQPYRGPGIPDLTFNDPPPGGRAFVTWQGGVGVNCSTIPVKNRTWGQVKSLYR